MTATLKEIKEKVLPPLDDELAKTASEFDTLAELRADIESRLREQLDAELETEFRAAAVDALVEASNIEPAEGLVAARANGLLASLVQSLERRGRLRRGLPRRLQPDARAGAGAHHRRGQSCRSRGSSRSRPPPTSSALEVTDEELRTFIREQAEAENDDGEADVDKVVDQVMADGRAEQFREDIRLREALDRIASEVKRIPLDLALAREKLWTPGQEKPAGATKLWTPGQEETSA